MAVFRIGSGLSNLPGGENNSAAIIGGKAASLVAMQEMGLDVPPAIVIPCALTFEFQNNPEHTLNTIRTSVQVGMEWIEQQVGRKCLFSVRSGAPVSCPGMMDTILNVGLTADLMPEFEKTLLGAKAAKDSWKRLVEMYGTTVLALPKAACTPQAEWAKKLWLMSPLDQVMDCVGAVFKSWMSERCVEYRKINNIPDTLGTAVTIQAMVYGNLNDNSGSGVLFTRDPSSGEPKIMCEYLMNAQGEDVVAGTHTPIKLDFNNDIGLPWQHDLHKVCTKLEAHYRDMVDVEFTVENDKLYILQSRKGKRTHKAAVRIAKDLLTEEIIKPEDLKNVLNVDQVVGAVTRSIIKTGTAKLAGKGLAAGGGVVRGRLVSTIEGCIIGSKVEPQILYRAETLPDDIAGMSASVGIVTIKGGATSHAAVVSRAMNKACVTGCGAMPLLKEGHLVVVDGDKGEVWLDDGSMVLSDGSEDDVLALARVLAEKGGYSLLHDLPVDGGISVVRVADVFDGDLTSSPYHFGALSSKMGSNPEQMVVDLSKPGSFVHADDQEIFGLMFSGLEQKWVEIAKALHGQFQHKDLKKVVVIDPESYIPKKLATSVRVANTVADAFSGDPVVLPEDFVERVVGGNEMMAKLVETLGKPKGLGPTISPYSLILKSIA